MRVDVKARTRRPKLKDTAATTLLELTWDEYSHPGKALSDSAQRRERGTGTRWELGEDYVSGGGRQQWRRDHAAGIPPASLQDAFDKAQAAEPPDQAPQRVARVRRCRRLAEEGDEVSVHRAFDGDPQCWIRRRREAKRPLFVIGYNISQSAFVPAGHFAGVIARAVRSIEAMMAAGYAVRVVALEYCRQSRENPLTTWEAKGYSEPLDTGRLLSIGAPGTLRDLNFCWLERMHKEAGMQLDSGYGTPLAVPKSLQEYLGIDVMIEGHERRDEAAIAAELAARAAEAQGSGAGAAQARAAELDRRWALYYEQLANGERPK